jgi:hypothetical protein
LWEGKTKSEWQPAGRGGWPRNWEGCQLALLVAAFQHATGERSGKRLDVTACQVMSFRDGQIADVRGHYSDLYHVDEFWS